MRKLIHSMIPKNSNYCLLMNYLWIPKFRQK